MKSAAKTRSERRDDRTRPGLHPERQPDRNMQGSLTPLSVLGPQADDERRRIREQFAAGAGAGETLRALCELADNNIRQTFGQVLRVHNTPPAGLYPLPPLGYDL